jgi:hypothetical protein
MGIEFALVSVNDGVADPPGQVDVRGGDTIPSGFSSTDMIRCNGCFRFSSASVLRASLTISWPWLFRKLPLSVSSPGVVVVDAMARRTGAPVSLHEGLLGPLPTPAKERGHVP